MKFGKQFEFYKIPEWYEYYYDYKTIRYVLNLLDNRPKKRKKLKALLLLKSYFEKKNTLNSTESNILKHHNTLTSYSSLSSLDIELNLRKKEKELKEFNIKKKRILAAENLLMLPNEQKLKRFICIYKEKLKFVDDFFTQKLGQYFEEVKKLESKIDIMKAIDNPHDDNNIIEELNAERDEMGYAVSWKRALSNLYNETSWLHGYHSINSLAIEKIKKKATKVFRLYGIEIEKILEDINSEYPFFSTSPFNLFNLRLKAQKLYAEQFNRGNVKKAHNELESRLLGQKDNKKYIFCLFVGIIISFIFFYVIIKIIDGKNTNDSFKPFFPFFSFSYIIILVLALIGIAIIILRHYRLNYAFLFELDMKSKIDLTKIFQFTLCLAALWMILFVLTKLALKFNLFGGEYTLFPLLMNAVLVVILFLPFHVCYLSLRKGVLTTLIRNMFPFGKNTVRFKDFTLGNILCSLADPFKNLFVGYCLMVCRDCYVYNKRGPCNRDTVPCLLIGIYPTFIRWTQCMNKFYYTRLIWPHFFGFLKVTFAMANNLAGFFYNRNKNHIRLAFRLTLASIATCYNLFWDFYLDWGLFKRNNNYIFLREKIAYHQAFYYFAMCYDIIISTMWTWNFIPLRSSLSEWKFLLTCTLEVFKRFIWVLIRIENEIIANPEGYRSILAIPELPLEYLE